MDTVKDVPWHLDADGDIEGRDGTLIALIYEPDCTHILFAAPDMLEALKEIVGTADEYKAMPTKSLLDRLLNAIGDARPAIAKATGGGQ